MKTNRTVADRTTQELRALALENDGPRGKFYAIAYLIRRWPEESRGEYRQYSYQQLRTLIISDGGAA